VKLLIVEDRGDRDSEAGDDQRVDFALLQFLSQLVNAVSQTVLFDGRFVAVDDPILRDAVVGVVVELHAPITLFGRFRQDLGNEIRRGEFHLIGVEPVGLGLSKKTTSGS
jgi:hypothetical protein